MRPPMLAAPGAVDFLADRLRAARLAGAKRGGEDAVAVERLRGCRAAETPVERARPLGQERRPHLEHGVREAELEDAARDGREHRLAAELGALPDLSSFADSEALDGLRR